MRRSILLAGAVGMLLGGCAAADISPSDISPSATVTTLTPNAGDWFTLSFQPVPEDGGKYVSMRGYVRNTYGEAVGRVQLLAQALDANGNVVDEKVAYVPGAIQAFDRVYYEMPALRAASQYRVTVWAYERRKFW